jgi:hypothetical protein
LSLSGYGVEEREGEFALSELDKQEREPSIKENTEK